jgi:hypothetical protein
MFTGTEHQPTLDKPLNAEFEQNPSNRVSETHIHIHRQRDDIPNTSFSYSGMAHKFVKLLKSIFFTATVLSCTTYTRK